MDNDEARWARYAELDWVQIHPNLNLHQMATMDDLERAELEWGGEGVTTCGKRGWLIIPGLFSRMGSTRCDAEHAVR